MIGRFRAPRGGANYQSDCVVRALFQTASGQGLFDLAVRLGAPIALKDIGMPADGLDRAARLATEQPYANPRPIEYAGVRQLIEDAYHGTRPA